MNSKHHKARKRFGQNFLIDQNIINQIIHSIAATSDQHIVEIGPGQGALTRELVEIIPHLDVVEIDRDLIVHLNKQDYAPQLTIHNQDALKFDFQQLPKPLRVIGNLPYNISTPLLFHLLAQVDHIADMHFMLQKEVVARLAAEPNSKDYGRLSIMVQYFCQVEHLFDVPPHAFKPQPQVTSAIVKLTPRTAIEPKLKSVEKFRDIVRSAFNQRRKMLRKSLRELVSAEQFEQANISSNLRPEQLSVKDWVNLVNCLD